MSPLTAFLTTPLLPARDRLRLVAFVAGCRRIENHGELDATPLDAWLKRRCGTSAYTRLWQPLLDAKFDGRHADLPATYIWARTRRMAEAQDAAGRVATGWLPGGHRRLVAGLADAIRARGGTIRLGSEVHWLVGDAGGMQGLVAEGGLRTYDHIVSTLLPPANARLFSSELAECVPADPCRYLGIVCAVLRTRRSVSPFHTLNILGRRVPLTTIVETTDAGDHVLYAARYVAQGHPDLIRPASDVIREYEGHVRTVFPEMAPCDVIAAGVQRHDVVEPVHVLGAAGQVPDMFPIRGLTLASAAHVYPAPITDQSLIGVADRAAAGTAARLGLAHRVAA